MKFPKLGENEAQMRTHQTPSLQDTATSFLLKSDELLIGLMLLAARAEKNLVVVTMLKLMVDAFPLIARFA